MCRHLPHDNEDQTIDQFLQLLREKFVPPAAGTAARANYRSTCQLQDETIKQFSSKLLEQFFLAYPARRDEYNADADLIEHFITKLSCDRVAELVMGQSPQTYAAAYNAAESITASQVIMASARQKPMLNQITEPLNTRPAFPGQGIKRKSNNTQLGFREPITHQIISYSAPVPCDPIMPVMHNLVINGRAGWYCLTPALTPCRAPMELDPTVKFQLSARHYGAELGSNLYAAWQETAHQVAMFAHNTRKGVLDAMGQRAREQGQIGPGQDWQPGMPISDGQFQTMVETMGNIISPLFSLLGNGVW